MTFREFMQRYRKKRKRIEKFAGDFVMFRSSLASFAEKHLKKAYNAGYLEGLGEGFERGWNECKSVHEIKVVEVRNEANN